MRYLSLGLMLFLLSGCRAPAPFTPPADHPASAQAPEAPTTAPSATLRLESDAVSRPATQPEMPAMHDMPGMEGHAGHEGHADHGGHGGHAQ